MKISVIVCAAGKGTRAGFEKNKLLTVLHGATVLGHTLDAFERADRDGSFEKICVCAADDMETKAVASSYGWLICDGGDTRTKSVYNALKQVTGDVVLIHDGARPFVTEDIIYACIDCVKEFGSAVCAMPATDTIAVEKDGSVDFIPARNKVFNLQTPQAFDAEQIKSAYEKAVLSGDEFTDDSSIYSRYIRPAKICPCGTAKNRKLTFNYDFDDAFFAITPRIYAGERKKIGLGADVHAFGKAQNFVTLCGEKIPCDSGLIAHSDGDVAIHALMDALLSAAGLKDIGHYFPDGDKKYKDADSMRLLKTVKGLITEKGLTVANVSMTIQAEKPKIAPHICAMQRNIADVLEIETEYVGISAGTCEGLGYVGERRGICAYAAVLLNEVNDG